MPSVHQAWVFDNKPAFSVESFFAETSPIRHFSGQYYSVATMQRLISPIGRSKRLAIVNLLKRTGFDSQRIG